MVFNNTMFVATGNGGFDPANDQYGDSVLKLSLPDLAVSASLLSHNLPNTILPTSAGASCKISGPQAA